MEPSEVPHSPDSPRRRQAKFQFNEEQQDDSWFDARTANKSPTSPVSSTAHQAPSLPFHPPSPVSNDEQTLSPRMERHEGAQHHHQGSAYGSNVRSSEDAIGIAKSPELDGPEQAPSDVKSPDVHVDEFSDAVANADAEEVDGRDSYAASIGSGSQHSSRTNQTATTSSTSSRLPDFLGPDVFQLVLHNPTCAHQLLLFCQSRLCGENMEFLEKVNQYHTLINEVTKLMFEIHRNYIVVNAPSQINIAANLRISTNKNLKHTFTSILPKMESVFVDAQDDIERLVGSGVYPRFVRHQMSMSAAKALASDRSRYAGLGDCFVLTSPSKADNPIVYASDGFVKVTGYTRQEIIPRNCRFLQGRHTDQAATKRIKKTIDERKESVELLLNYKRNGEPFWNLLYTTPLYDINGNVVFFLGGQVNCSTTIHNTSDILRVLSTSVDVDEETAEKDKPGPSLKESKSSSILKALRPSSKNPPALRDAGMEPGLLNEFQKLDMGKQMDAFYTAYSKYIVINYSTFFIAFYSVGIVDLLYPYKPQASAQIVGTDIFRFLKYHGLNDSLRALRDKVKSTLKTGAPVSLDLMLCTRRYMGFEKFATHWTPLKDENGNVEFVILTMGSHKL